MSKRTLFRAQSITAIVSVLSCGAILATMIGIGAKANTQIDGWKAQYGLVFSQSKNKLDASLTETSATAYTNLANPISFTYKGISADEGNWAKLESSAYLFNSTPLSGLGSITVSFGSSSADLSLSYGWEKDGAIKYESTGIVLNAANPTFSFDGYQPSFFKLSIGSSSTAQIASLSLVYSCSATTDPIEGADQLTFKLINGGTAYEVASCAVSATSVVIPATRNGKPVVSLGYRSFSQKSKLTSVIIPSSVTSIGEYAFYDSDALASISLPSTITKIGDGAFYDDMLLSSVVLPQSMSEIGHDSFTDCPLITSFELAPGNTNFMVEDGILYSYDKSKLIRCPDGKAGDVTISEGVTEISDNAFFSCDFVTSISIPTGVTTIGQYAFFNCPALKTVTMPDTVNTISIFAFYMDTALSSMTLSSSLLEISDSCFAYCSSLTSIAIPSSVQTIGGGAFANCTSLADVSIQTDSWLGTIREGAFISTAISSFYVPAGLLMISQQNVFSQCLSLSSITADTTNPNYFSDNGILYAKNQPEEGKNEVFICPKAPYGSLSIPSSVMIDMTTYPITYVGTNAFSECSKLTDLTLPSSITGIGDGGLSGLAWITSITFEDPSTLITVGDNAFAGDGNITSLQAFTSLTSIGMYAFTGCRGLLGFYVSSTVTYIGRSAFSYCYTPTIYCQADSQPGTWDADWNIDNLTVMWSQTLA